jgi:tetratricopeptide (TPR) repeat protein
VTSGSGIGDQVDEVLRVARFYIEIRRYDRAREVLHSSLSHHPNDPDLLAHYAQTELLLRNYMGAAKSAYAALSVAPHTELAMRIYTFALDGLGRHYDALSMAWRAVIEHPNEALPHRVYATLLQKTRQLPLALRAIEESIRLNPADVDSLVLRGFILHDLGRIRESTASYRAALRLDPTNAAALNDIAVNRLEARKLGRALRGFLAAAGLDPELGDLARKSVGAVLTQLFRRVTIIVVLLGFPIAMAGTAYSNGESTAIFRVIIGLMTVSLIAASGWLLRPLPPRVLASALREHSYVAARAVHAAIAVATGTWVTIFGGEAWTIPAGVFLIVGGLLLLRVGRMIGT